MSSIDDTKKADTQTYLAIVDGEVDVVEGVMSRAVDHLFQRVSSHHVGIVDLKKARVSTQTTGCDVDGLTKTVQILIATKSNRYVVRWIGKM